MADPWHVKWLSEGVKRWNLRRRKVHFAPDLSGINLFHLLPPDFRDTPKTSRFFERIDLSQANLTGANLSGLNFRKAKFNHANLTGADMSLSNFDDAKFLEANLVGANLSRSYFNGALFDQSRLSGVSFSDVSIAGATFIRSELDERQRQALTLPATRTGSDFVSYNSLEPPQNIKEATDGSRRSPLYEGEKAEPPTRKNKYDVFFSTNRAQVIERGELVGFTGDLSPEINYGVCEVVVPEGRRVGSLGSRLWKRLLNRTDDRLRRETLIGLNDELFWSLLRETSAAMKVKERPSIFVHGFNNTFDQAVIRAAQIGYDLGLGQGISLFSWPSKGGVGSYSADEASSEASKYALANFIEEFVRNSPHGSANIIAHSMGCRCVLGAFEVLSNKRTNVLKRINQVILAAADVDAAIMPHLGKHVVKHSTRTTSYVSDSDTALKVSGWLHRFPRVGITPPTFVLEGMDTILVNKMDLGDFGHAYFGSSRVVLSDMFTLLKANLPPNERHAIEAVSTGGHDFWRIRE